MVMRRWLSGVPAVVLVPLATGLLAMDWGLPCTDTWAPDALSPRASGLGALVDVYTPGHFHIYPPLHLLVLTLVALPWILLAVLRVGTNPGRLEQELIQLPPWSLARHQRHRAHPYRWLRWDPACPACSCSSCPFQRRKKIGEVRLT